MFAGLQRQTRKPTFIGRVFGQDLWLLVQVALIYTASAALLAHSYRENPTEQAVQGWLATARRFDLGIIDGAWLLVPIGLCVVLVPRGQRLVHMMRSFGLFLVCAWIMATYFVTKVTLPHIAPFFADPMLAEVDLWLHLGHRPIDLTHAFAPYINADFLATTYPLAWFLPACFLPVLVALIDSNWARRRQFIYLYAFAWIGLGNVLALAGMSAGPVYYERLFGGAAFSDIDTIFRASGLADTYLPKVQEHLWQLHLFRRDSHSPGISAFPSVHVAMATVIALYLYSLHRRLWPIAVLIVGFYQFCSVYLGWHYAVDGYASIVLILGLRWLQTRTLRGEQDRATVSGVAVDRGARAA